MPVYVLLAAVFVYCTSFLFHHQPSWHTANTTQGHFIININTVIKTRKVFDLYALVCVCVCVCPHFTLLMASKKRQLI